MKMTVNESLIEICNMISEKKVPCENCPVYRTCTDYYDDELCKDQGLLLFILRNHYNSIELERHYKSNESETCDGIPKYGRNA